MLKIGTKPLHASARRQATERMHEAAQRYREERAALGEEQSKHLEAMPSGKQAYAAYEAIRAVGGEPPRWRKAPSGSKAAAGPAVKQHRAAPARPQPETPTRRFVRRKAALTDRESSPAQPSDTHATPPAKAAGQRIGQLTRQLTGQLSGKDAFLRMKARDPSRFISQVRVAPVSKVQLAVHHE